jgi:hypothetical protein
MRKELLISVADSDPGSAAFFTLGSGIGNGFFRIPDKHPGSATLLVILVFIRYTFSPISLSTLPCSLLTVFFRRSSSLKYAILEQRKFFPWYRVINPNPEKIKTGQYLAKNIPESDHASSDECCIFRSFSYTG